MLIVYRFDKTLILYYSIIGRYVVLFRERYESLPKCWNQSVRDEIKLNLTDLENKESFYSSVHFSFLLFGSIHFIMNIKCLTATMTIAGAHAASSAFPSTKPITIARDYGLWNIFRADLCARVAEPTF